MKFLWILASLASASVTCYGQDLTVVAQRQWGTPAVTSDATGTLRNNFDGWVGIRFVPNKPMTVDKLGRWTVSGNSSTHTLRLYNYLKAQLREVTVSTTGGAVDRYVYGAIDPVTLIAGQPYYLLSQEANAGDQWCDAFTLPALPSVCTSVIYSWGTAGPENEAGTSPAAFVGMNFTYVDHHVGVFGVAPPNNIQQGTGGPYTLGMKFKTTVAGNVVAIRYWKDVLNTGTHVGSIWSSGGTKLATVTFTGETASGWQRMDLATPLAISAETMYVVSVHMPTNFTGTSDYNQLGTAQVAGPVYVYADSESANGVYAAGAEAYPTSNFFADHYWVDLVFSP